MGVTPPSLDLACPQAEADIEKLNMSTCLEIEVSIK